LIKNIGSKHPNVYAYGLLDVSTQESIELNAESHWGKIEGEKQKKPQPTPYVGQKIAKM